MGKTEDEPQVKDGNAGTVVNGTGLDRFDVRDFYLAQKHDRFSLVGGWLTTGKIDSRQYLNILEMLNG